MQDYKVTYKIVEWRDLQEFEIRLNDYCNAGWSVDHHKLGQDSSGWTIFRKTIMLQQPLLERNIRVSEVYRILNRVLEPGSNEAHEFDLSIKSAVRLEGEF